MNKLTRLAPLLVIALVLVQWYVPARMIFDKEQVVTQGKTFKFKMAPIDPTDPFRGEYIRLSFEASNYYYAGIRDFSENQDLFIELENDTQGFVKVKNVSSQKPEASIDYVTAHFEWIDMSDSVIHFRYPFDRYYMKEGTAYDSELRIREAIRDSTQIAYAIVKVKSGDAVITDIQVNGTSLKELLD